MQRIIRNRLRRALTLAATAVLMAIVLALLPLGILYVLQKLLPPWPENEQATEPALTQAAAPHATV